MLKSHEKFYSADGKRLVVIAEDEMVNRTILEAYLQDDFHVLPAKDGQEALELIRANPDMLSLVLLDLLMPRTGGLDVLKTLMADPKLKYIPVIVMTSDQQSEIECLNLGASDFIPKPYPNREVVLARCKRVIELSEDREIIQETERDALTDLYNKDFFFRYAEQYDEHHRDTEMDAIVMDINHFHIVNERYGKAYGDMVLVRIARVLREHVGRLGGIVCRRGADTFLIYCPMLEDHRALLQTAVESLAGDGINEERVRLRMGVYARVDKNIDIERRFDHAKLAADTIRDSYTRSIAVYDNAMHESELYEETLIGDFRAGLGGGQFTVYYQPKYDIRPETPVLASAEALVRWKHPELGMVSPGVFIPLFEKNGLICELDQYVWEQAAAQIHRWKERFGVSVPVSVNVSCVDMYDPELE